MHEAAMHTVCERSCKYRESAHDQVCNCIVLSHVSCKLLSTDS